MRAAAANSSRPNQQLTGDAGGGGGGGGERSSSGTDRSGTGTGTGTGGGERIAGSSSSSSFRQTVCRQMMGIVLLIYVRDALLPFVRPPRLSSVGTGLLGIMGNKGAVAASLAIHSTSLCVVCAHLASG